MKSKVLLTGFIFLVTMSAKAGPIEEGKAIFMSRCAACHNVNKVMTGPALAGVDERRTFEWITRFVQSSQSLIKSGDKDAVAVFNQFNNIPMPDHADLSADHVKSIIDFIKSEAKSSAADAAPFAKPAKQSTSYRPLSISQDYWFFLLYLGAVAMLIAVLLFAVRLNGVKRKTGLDR